MRHDDNGAVGHDRRHKVLDRQRRDGVERRAGLVKQDHVGVERQRARNAQTLLLAARKRVGALVELVLDLVPKRRAAQAFLDHAVELVAVGDAVALRRKRDVVANGLAERVGLLEHHANGTAQLVGVFGLGVYIAPAIVDLALHAAAANLAIHQVEAAQEGRLTAARRPDERCDLTLVEVERRVVQRMVVAIVHIDVLGGERDLVAHGLAAHANALLALPHARQKVLGLGRDYLGCGRCIYLAHSAVILLASCLPTIRATTLNSSTQIISSAAVPQTICCASGLPSP